MKATTVSPLDTSRRAPNGVPCTTASLLSYRISVVHDNKTSNLRVQYAQREFYNIIHISAAVPSVGATGAIAQTELVGPTYMRRSL
jgi:hypothetical protein